MNGTSHRWCVAARHFISNDSLLEHFEKWFRGPPGAGRSLWPLLPNITHCRVRPATPRRSYRNCFSFGCSTALPLHNYTQIELYAFQTSITSQKCWYPRFISRVTFCTCVVRRMWRALCLERNIHIRDCSEARNQPTRMKSKLPN